MSRTATGIALAAAALLSTVGCAETPRRSQAPTSMSTERLALALRDGDWTVRRNAARALGRLGPAAGPAARDLYCALQDTDPRVRATAEWALQRVESRAGPQKGPAMCALEGRTR
jgi:hypothetical protein